MKQEINDANLLLRQLVNFATLHSVVFWGGDESVNVC